MYSRVRKMNQWKQCHNYSGNNSWSNRTRSQKSSNNYHKWTEDATSQAYSCSFLKMNALGFLSIFLSRPFIIEGEQKFEEEKNWKMRKIYIMWYVKEGPILIPKCKMYFSKKWILCSNLWIIFCLWLAAALSVDKSNHQRSDQINIDHLGEHNKWRSKIR